MNIEDLKKKAYNKSLIILDIVPLRKKEDIAGAKIAKALEIIRYQLAKNGFKAYDSGFEFDEDSFIYLILEKKPLEKIKIHEGPFIKYNVHVERFKNTHKTTFVKGSMIYAKVEREFV